MIEEIGTTETKSNRRGSGSALNCFVIFLILCVIAIPFMFFVDLLTPKIDRVNIQGYLMCLFSVVGTFLFMNHIAKKTTREQYAAMRGDGLSDETIKRIVGEDEYRRMKEI